MHSNDKYYNLSDSLLKYDERKARRQCTISWIEGSFTFFVVGAGCFMAAFVSPSWVSTAHREGHGAWQECRFDCDVYNPPNNCSHVCRATVGQDADPQLAGVQTLLVLSLIVLLATAAMFLLYLSDFRFPPDTDVLIRHYYNFLQVLAGALILLASILFVLRPETSGGYWDFGLYLALASSVILTANGALNMLLARVWGEGKLC